MNRVVAHEVQAHKSRYRPGRGFRQVDQHIHTRTLAICAEENPHLLAFCFSIQRVIGVLKDLIGKVGRCLGRTAVHLVGEQLQDLLAPCFTPRLGRGDGLASVADQRIGKRVLGYFRLVVVGLCPHRVTAQQNQQGRGTQNGDDAGHKVRLPMLDSRWSVRAIRSTSYLPGSAPAICWQLTPMWGIHAQRCGGFPPGCWLSPLLSASETTLYRPGQMHHNRWLMNRRLVDLPTGRSVFWGSETELTHD